ncbi:MAG: type II toxin-antitoxin system VapC family toxin [Blastochloris sp.]|nr:type II toxin-antitoxin system VapC family toxin [Blastochloris sp.]
MGGQGGVYQGAQVAGQPLGEVRAFINRFPTLWPDDEMIEVYVQIYSALRRQNQLIGPHDLWIAAAALVAGTPLITRNRQEFQRVPSLKLNLY